MVVILVIALALAPVNIILKTPKKEWIVVTVAFEVILLPVVVSLFVLYGMEPGEQRTRVSSRR